MFLGVSGTFYPQPAAPVQGVLPGQEAFPSEATWGSLALSLQRISWGLKLTSDSMRPWGPRQAGALSVPGVPREAEFYSQGPAVTRP